MHSRSPAGLHSSCLHPTPAARWVLPLKDETEKSFIFEFSIQLTPVATPKSILK